MKTELVTNIANEAIFNYNIMKIYTLHIKSLRKYFW